MIFFSNKNRPFHWGPYALERLPKDPAVLEREGALPRVTRPAWPELDESNPLALSIRKYHDMFSELGVVEPRPNRAPVPDDLARRAQDVKGAAYFLDTDQVGICKMPENAWYQDVEARPHTHAVVIVEAHGRTPEPDNVAYEFVNGQEAAAANLRAFEVAIAVSEHIQWMGYDAKAHDRWQGEVDVDRLAVLAGLCLRDGDGLVNPFLDKKFAVTVVTTDYDLATDVPLGSGARRAKGLGYWIGAGGAVPGLEWSRRKKRKSDMSSFPLEQVDRVDRPTTLIIDEEVPQVSKRAEFFERAARGDLGEKSKVERSRFSFKNPFAQAMVSLIRCMVPEQERPVADTEDARWSDPVADAKAIKSMSYFLGAEMTGICEIPRYAYYSHRKDGSEVPYNHKYAIVMLIDQGYETMEGASGDDYISGAQSMRAYMRGAEIAGVIGDMLRRLGFRSRPETNADSDVLHVPLVLWAGLGELSRIGEVILNPFIGPRMKTVVLTTDLPLETDRPMDFGLQYFCSSCYKCARECPCDAITWGDKVMFNGYEMWKPDVERCTRYRLTNPKGLACGRCMKTCPLNKVVTWEGPLATVVASWFGVNVRWMKPLLVPIAVKMDDWLGHGVRNPVKKWWLDLEIVDGHAVHPRKGVNQRDLNLDHVIDPKKQPMAYYHADVMPAPNETNPKPINRKDALKAAELLETPAEALDRIAKGGAKPGHYVPPPVRELAEGEVVETAKAIWDKNWEGKR